MAGVGAFKSGGGVAADKETRLAELEAKVREGGKPASADFRLIGVLRILPDDDAAKKDLNERANRIISELRARELERLGRKWDKKLEKHAKSAVPVIRQGKYPELLSELEKKIEQGKKPTLSDLNFLTQVRDLPTENPASKDLPGAALKIISTLKNRDLARLGKNWDTEFEKDIGKEIEGSRLTRLHRKAEVVIDTMFHHNETPEELAARQGKKIVAIETPKDTRKGEDEERKKQAALQSSLAEAEAKVSSYADSSENLVGYERIRKKLRQAVEYWVVRNPQYRAASAKHPPPQVFIIKGASGMGKTELVQAIMYDATIKSGKPRNIPIYTRAAGIPDFGSKYVNESEKATAGVFDQAFSRPSILFIDEIQAIANKNTDSAAGDSDGLGAQIAGKVQDTMLQKINDMTREGKQCILILATDDPDALPAPLKRRGTHGTFNLEDELTRADLVEITKRSLEKSHIDSVKPGDVFDIIESKVHMLGHTRVTPADVANAVRAVADAKVNPALEAELERSLNAAPGQAVAAEPIKVEITLDDFRQQQLNKIKEYDEDQKSKDIQHMVTRTRPKTTLDDVGGLPVKHKLYKDVDAAMDYENTRALGAKPITGILLHGTPGTGKTWLAEALAGSVNATVYKVRGSELMKPHFGESEKLIKGLFAEARKNAPSIILIDEIDAVAQNRDAQNSHRGAVTALLTEMSGSTPLNGVVVVGTTNRLDSVDPAFRRSGRFDRIVKIGPPKTREERMQVIKVHLDKCRKFTDDSVNEEKILDVFGKRTLIPATIERMISDAVQLRADEIKAAKKITEMPREDSVQSRKKMETYGDELGRIYLALGIDAKPGTSIIGIPETAYERLRGMDNDSYKLNISHFKSALDVIRDEDLDKIRKFSSDIRGTDTAAAVGTVYGLFAMPDNASGGLAGAGGVGIIECIPHVLKRGAKGDAHVEGSEIDESIKSSAKHAWYFLNGQSDWALGSHEFHIEFVSIMKGIDHKTVSGPSAGAAIALAEYSAATGQAVLPNVLITGAITQRGVLTPVGGLDSEGMGKFFAAAAEPGIDTIVIPKSNYDSLPEEDRIAIEKLGLKIISAKDFWEVARIALASHPDESKAKELLRDAGKRKYLRKE